MSNRIIERGSASTPNSFFQTVAFNGDLIPVDGVSDAVNISGADVISIFGHTSAATTLIVQMGTSLGGAFFDSSDTIVIAGAGDFGKDFTIGAPFIRLK